MKNLTKTLKQIEDVLNTRDNYELEYWDYKFIKEDGEFVLYTYDGEFIEDSFILNVADVDNETIIKDIINVIYEEEINYRQKFVNGENAFNRRKIKSLATWMSRERMDKVAEINEELINYRSMCNKYKMDIDTYKSYVNDLYNALNVLCPDWKLNEICDYLIDQDIFDEVLPTLTGVIAFVDDKAEEMEIDNFTRKENVLRELRQKLMKEKVAQ